MSTRKNITRALLAVAAVVSLTAFFSKPAAAQWWNPTVIDTGSHVSGSYYDPFSGRWVVRTDRTKVRASYYDPARGYVDPGSLRYVNRIDVDEYGRRWQVYGWSWTSFGKPHGNLKRRRITSTGYPGVVHDQNENILYMEKQPKPGNNFGPGPGVIHDQNENVLYSAEQPGKGAQKNVPKFKHPTSSNVHRSLKPFTASLKFGR